MSLVRRNERCLLTWSVSVRAKLNNILTQGGFRRSQSIAYRPACEGCRACISVRVVAKDFRPTQSMRRTLRRNADIASRMRIAVPTSEQYAIFRAYLDSRHHDGVMADMTVLDYAMMVEDSHIETRIIEYRRRKPLQQFSPRARARARGVGTTRSHRRGLRDRGNRVWLSYSMAVRWRSATIFASRARARKGCGDDAIT